MIYFCFLGFGIKSRVMENMNEEIDLGLSLGATNQQRVESCSDSGAGVNADLGSRIDTTNTNTNTNTKPFVRPHPLTELVWSTQNGLTIKYTGCSPCFAHTKDDERVIDASFFRSTLPLAHTGTHNMTIRANL